MTTSVLLRRGVQLAGGSAAGQAIALLAAPALARLYSPDEFGALATFSSLGLLLASVSNLRYEAGIPLAETDREGLALLRLSVLFTAAVAAATGVAGWFLRPSLPHAAWLGGIAWPLLLPLIVLPLGLYHAYSGWAVRQEATGVLGRSRAYQSATGVCSQLALSGTTGGVGLLLGEVIGRFVGVGTLRRFVRHDVPPAIEPDATDVRRAATTYRALAGYLLPATLASTAAVQLPVIVAPSLFGAAEGGSLFMVVRVGMAPTLLLGTAIGQVLLGTLGGASDLTSARVQADRILTALVAVYLPLGGAATASAPFIATTVLGDEWTHAGHVARALSPLLVTWSVASPLSVLLLVGRRESESLLVAVLDLIARSAALLIGWAAGSFMLAMVVLGGVGGAVGTVSVIRCFRAVGAPLAPAVTRMGPAVLAGLCCAGASWGLAIGPMPAVARVAGIAIVALAGAAVSCVHMLRRSPPAPSAPVPVGSAR